MGNIFAELFLTMVAKKVGRTWPTEYAHHVQNHLLTHLQPLIVTSTSLSLSLVKTCISIHTLCSRDSLKAGRND